MARSRVTITDLAHTLGLDKSSVSHALRGTNHVSEETRQRVLAAAQRLGYRPNLAARHLASSSGAHVIAFVLPPSFAPLRYGMVAAAMEVVAQQAAGAGLLFGVFTTEEIIGDLSKIHQNPLINAADGLLLWGDTGTDVTSRMAVSGRPIVVLDPNHPSFAGYTGPIVRVDNAGGAAAVTQHVIDQGAQNMLLVMHDRNHLGHQERSHGARSQWLKSQPLENFRFCMFEELTDSTLRSFVGLPSPAIVCSFDWGALHVWHRLTRLGIRVPEHVLLAGFDGEIYGSLIGLTTAVFDGKRLGNAAFELLMRLIRSATGGPFALTVPMEMRVGASTTRQPA